MAVGVGRMSNAMTQIPEAVGQMAGAVTERLSKVSTDVVEKTPWSNRNSARMQPEEILDVEDISSLLVAHTQQLLTASLCVCFEVGSFTAQQGNLSFGGRHLHLVPHP